MPTGPETSPRLKPQPLPAAPTTLSAIGAVLLTAGIIAVGRDYRAMPDIDDFTYLPLAWHALDPALFARDGIVPDYVLHAPAWRPLVAIMEATTGLATGYWLLTQAITIAVVAALFRIWTRLGGGLALFPPIAVLIALGTVLGIGRGQYDGLIAPGFHVQGLALAFLVWCLERFLARRPVQAGVLLAACAMCHPVVATHGAFALTIALASGGLRAILRWAILGLTAAICAAPVLYPLAMDLLERRGTDDPDAVRAAIVDGYLFRTPHEFAFTNTPWLAVGLIGVLVVAAIVGAIRCMRPPPLPDPPRKKPVAHPPRPEAAKPTPTVKKALPEKWLDEPPATAPAPPPTSMEDFWRKPAPTPSPPWEAAPTTGQEQGGEATPDWARLARPEDQVAPPSALPPDWVTGKAAPEPPPAPEPQPDPRPTPATPPPIMKPAANHRAAPPVEERFWGASGAALGLICGFAALLIAALVFHGPLMPEAIQTSTVLPYLLHLTRTTPVLIGLALLLAGAALARALREKEELDRATAVLLGLALATAALFQQVLSEVAFWMAVNAGLLLALAAPRLPVAGAIAALVGAGCLIHAATADVLTRPPPKGHTEVYDWIRKLTPPNALFIIPPGLESFRVHTRRAAVVDFKTFPASTVASIGEWRRKLEMVADPDPVALRARGWEAVPQWDRAHARADGARIALLLRETGADYFLWSALTIDDQRITPTPSAPDGLRMQGLRVLYNDGDNIVIGRDTGPNVLE